VRKFGNDARAIPELYVFSVNVLLGRLSGLFIVRAVNDGGRAVNVPFAVHKVDAVRRQLRRPYLAGFNPGNSIQRFASA
jgi:hypothetical protein